MSLTASSNTGLVASSSAGGTTQQRSFRRVGLRRPVRRERLDVHVAMITPTEQALQSVPGFHGLHG